MSALHSFMGVGRRICEIEPRRGWSTEGETRGRISQGHKTEIIKQQVLSEQVQIMQKQQFGDIWLKA